VWGGVFLFGVVGWFGLGCVVLCGWGASSWWGVIVISYPCLFLSFLWKLSPPQFCDCLPNYDTSCWSHFDNRPPAFMSLQHRRRTPDVANPLEIHRDSTESSSLDDLPTDEAFAL